MGTPDFSTPILEAIIREGYQVVGVVTQPDRPVGRKRILTPTPVKQTALTYEIPVFQPEKIKEDYQQVINWKPDLIITAAFGQIIPKVLLDFPRLGCINVHASLLPKYRGGAPIHKAIMKGEKETGVTIMYMDVKMDTGDMISSVVVPIEEDDHTGSMFEKLSVAGAQLLVKTLPSLIAGQIKRVSQNHDAATFAWNIKREDEKINWNQTARDIYNHIRGLHPWPVAFTTLEDVTVKVWWATVVEKKYEAEPGTIVEIEKDGIVVSCKDQTAIKITDVQFSGKRRMDIASLLNGTHPVEIGKKFN